MAKKKNKEQQLTDKTENLTNLISDTINKSVKESNAGASYFLNEDGPVNINDWVSSGSTVLDVIMSNIKGGGFPVGRITELTGVESSGKSLMASHAIANVQKKGGIGVYIDVEQSVDVKFLKAIGVSTDKLVYANIETVEEIFQSIEEIINAYRNKTTKTMAIVVDSIAAATTIEEMKSDFKKDGYATDKAIIISKALRKITNLIAKENICLILTNQLRERMASFGDPYTTSGGRAPAHHASIRLRLTPIGKINGYINKVSKVLGTTVRVETIKNRIAPQFQKVNLNIYFDSGICDYESWLKELNDMGAISQNGAWYTYVNENTGEEIKFQASSFYDKVLSNKEFYDDLYDKLTNGLIRHYKKTDEVVKTESIESNNSSSKNEVKKDNDDQ